MISSTYVLPTPNPYLSHGLTRTWFLRDRKSSRRDELHVQVRSGDYFASTATVLDHIAQTVKRKQPIEAEDLQRMVDDFLDLQRDYQIVVKGRNNKE